MMLVLLNLEIYRVIDPTMLRRSKSYIVLELARSYSSKFSVKVVTLMLNLPKQLKNTGLSFLPKIGIVMANLIVTDTLKLKVAARSVGHIDKVKSHDGVIRQVQPVRADVCSLAWEAIAGYNFHQQFQRSNVPPIDRNFWISWPGKVINAHHYSFSSILHLKTDRQWRQIEQALSNKIILIGVTANGANQIDTPFDRSDGASSIYLHAAIVDNLLNKTQLQIPPNEWLFLVLLGTKPSLKLLSE